MSHPSRVGCVSDPGRLLRGSVWHDDEVTTWDAMESHIKEPVLIPGCPVPPFGFLPMRTPAGRQAPPWSPSMLVLPLAVPSPGMLSPYHGCPTQLQPPERPCPFTPRGASELQEGLTHPTHCPHQPPGSKPSRKMSLGASAPELCLGNNQSPFHQRGCSDIVPVTRAVGKVCRRGPPYTGGDRWQPWDRQAERRGGGTKAHVPNKLILLLCSAGTGRPEDL